MYSLGVLLNEMLAGACPWAAAENDAHVMERVARLGERPPPGDSDALPGLGELISCAWAQDAAARPTATKVVCRLMLLQAQLAETQAATDEREAGLPAGFHLTFVASTVDTLRLAVAGGEEQQVVSAARVVEEILYEDGDVALLVRAGCIPVLADALRSHLGSDLVAEHVSYALFLLARCPLPILVVHPARAAAILATDAVASLLSLVERQASGRASPGRRPFLTSIRLLFLLAQLSGADRAQIAATCSGVAPLWRCCAPFPTILPL